MITAKKLFCICFQPFQRANLCSRKSLGLFLSGLFELAWDTLYHTIKTGTFKQVKQSQLWWNPPPNRSGPTQGDKFILIQSPSLIVTPLPPHRQITIRHPEINWKKRSKMFELSWPEIPFWAECCSPSICPSNKLSLLVCATEYNWLVYFSSCNTSSYISCTTLRHMQNINKSRQKPSRVLLLDVSYTLGSNLLLQVGPYEHSVPSQVSQIKKTKALRLEMKHFLSLLCTESIKYKKCSFGWSNDWKSQQHLTVFCSKKY